MKLTKLFGLLGMACVLTLAACGQPGGNTPGGDDEDESEDEGEDSEDEPGLSYSALSVLKENNKVYVQIEGSVDEGVVTGNSMKAAFGITDGDEFIVGKEEPEAADYNITVPLTDGEFSAKVEMPTTGLQAGQYQVFFGPKDYYGRASGSVGEEVVNDDNFTFYFRSDTGVSGATLCLDAMPPVRIQTASIELNVAGHAGGIFAKIGGAKKGSLDQATLDGYDTFIDFQKLPNTTTSVAKYEEGMEAEENPGAYYFWKVEGDNAYIYVRINFMVADGATSGSYNTHLNVTENKQQNCRSEGDIDGDPVVVNAFGDTIKVSSHPNGGHTESNIWANLGFVTEIQSREAPAEDSSDSSAAE